MERWDIIEGIESTLNIVAGNLRNKAEVEKDFEELPLIFCNAQQVNQVFLNLLVNAAQSIDKTPGQIFIRTQKIGKDKVGIEIADNGVGIDHKDIGRIFDPFFTTKDVGLGMGMGLSISYRIIKDHGGVIKATSIPGEGSTFKVILPIDGPELQEPEL
jgi:signal transduction histidine kinase